MKRIIAVLMAVAMLIGASAMAEGTLRVGMECNYAPYNWTQSEPSEFAVPIEGGAGYADGYDVQIAKRLAEALGKELVVVKVGWDGLPPAVLSGSIDAIIAGMSPTAKRKLTLDFTDNYYSVELVVVVKKDGAFASAKTLDELNGAKLTGQLGTVHYDLLEQVTGAEKLTAMEDFPAMIVALQSGAIDGYVAERPGAEANIAANPDLTYLVFDEGKGFVLSEEDRLISVGLGKGSELLVPMNEALAAISDEERLQIMVDATARQPLMAQ